jgi:hypothetical protein
VDVSARPGGGALTPGDEGAGRPSCAGLAVDAAAGVARAGCGASGGGTWPSEGGSGGG